MNFNYRDFFIHNDDLHIIKEQLSILDELKGKVSKKDALAPNAKAVWDAWASEKNTQTIADKLGINVDTVKKIIQICLMNTDEKKNSDTIANEFKLATSAVQNVLNNALGSERQREIDTHFINDAVKIYNLHKSGKHPEEIVVLVNNEKKEYFEKINLDKVNLILKIVDITKKQMDVDGVVIPIEIEREIDKKISRFTISRLIKQLNLGEIKYTHKFTEEQDAFILYLYLQRNGTTERAKQFNAKFKTNPKGNTLNIDASSISKRLKKYILNPKGKGETDISKEVLDLLDKYEDTYFKEVNIEDLYTKELLTHYTPPETVRGIDPLARKGGKVDPTRQMSGQTGNLEPDIHQTINTGESPASGQLGKKSGAPINPQGALSL